MKYIMPLTKEEIIDETVEYYSEDVSRRSEKGMICYYIIPNEQTKCAVGRCLTDSSIDTIIGERKRSETLSGVADIIEFKPEYQGHDFDFWKELQMLHDNGDNWNKNGLSTIGEKAVEYMKKDFVS